MNALTSILLSVGCVALALPASAAEPSRAQGRSIVMSRQGIVAAEQPLASQAGATILAQGGNAIDAIVAANAVMGVVYPAANGLGGDLFAIIYEAKTGKLHGLNASGWAPAGMSIAQVKAKTGATDKMPQKGIHAVTVGGCAEGWDKLLTRFGRKKFSDVLAPAIAYAEGGFPVTEMIAWSGGSLKQDPNAAKTYLRNGTGPKVGTVFRNPDLAWSLREIVARGRAGYYEGEIARRIVATSERLGGTLTLADFAEFQAEWTQPISTNYRGWTVYELPPNGQGIAALAMLNLMETFPMTELGANTTRALHTMIEAKKLAYADMLRFVADPRFARVPVAGMLSKEYARERAKLIDPEHARDEVEAGRPPEPGTDTTYLCAVDSEGNMVSLIQSNYGGFGSGLVPDGCGFILQNRGGLFSLDPESPNALAPRKRPLHTIIPGFMEKGDVRIAFGVMNGWNQSQAHAQLVANLVDYKLNLQAAIEAPRFTKITFSGVDVSIESRVPAEIRAELEAKGHKITVLGPFSGTVGGSQAVMRDFATGVNFGASDPRKDGAAIPEPIVGVK
ncbi:MAG: gamma-glutamyltransferase [Opitutaceae bacterium]|nr:gamma-glutamyltransferase [Opitutaceae bacterium]